MIRLLALLLFATVATAAEPSKAALTQKEIDEGWIQLFDGESTFGWKVEGTAEVEKGKIALAPNSKLTYPVHLPPGMFLVRYLDSTDSGAVVKAFGKEEPLLVTSSGGVGIMPNGNASGVIEITNGSKANANIVRVLYRPGKPTALFNGKDLAGWKVHDEPRKNLSKFDVTPEGELRVTNGPGDLQTTGKYADFLLQFQCKTNGDGLNSGIFFRCIEGQYQNGYECQIQNAMVDNDPTKPKDFGTGAIYRRTPARKIVAKDKEWFNVTLVAHGDQFATWVNGYPVMQWKDERPADDNPRKGLRKAAGHLSIQGHDPTTDILFRKLQIAEFK
jgi:hypothetical protein